MSFGNCNSHDLSDWDSSPSPTTWDRFRAGKARFAEPGASYSLRANHLAGLRALVSESLAHRDDDVIHPAGRAVESAKEFLNNLPDGCLRSLRIALSHDGEINFFVGSRPRLFQALIDSEGRLSFYGKLGEREVSGSDITTGEFRYLDVLSFC